MPTLLRTALVRVMMLAVALMIVGGPAAASAEVTAADAALLVNLEGYADEMAADIDAFWRERLTAQGVDYRTPEVEVYTDTITIPCGATLVAGVTTTGYYCPINETIYLDGLDHLTVAKALGRGWLPSVLAHEWGHHVQTLLGRPPGGLFRSEALGVREELEADCLSGGWTASAAARELIEADAVDVTIYVLSFLGLPSSQQAAPLNQGHGTSEQRVRAFLKGYDGGVELCL
jgi:hypothetical protein